MRLQDTPTPLKNKALIGKLPNAAALDSFATVLHNNPRAKAAGFKTLMEFATAMPPTGHGDTVYNDWLKHRND